MSEQFSRILDDRPDMADDSDLAVMVDAYEELLEQNQAGWEAAQRNRERWEALLAVAKAAREHVDEWDRDFHAPDLLALLEQLDAAHPGWREW